MGAEGSTPIEGGVEGVAETKAYNKPDVIDYYDP
jgi:hypothetical protein